MSICLETCDTIEGVPEMTSNAQRYGDFCYKWSINIWIIPQLFNFPLHKIKMYEAAFELELNYDDVGHVPHFALHQWN